MTENASELSLHRAVFSGDFENVEKLLKNMNEEKVNGQDIHGNTALHIAVMKGDKRCVEALLKSGAMVLIRNELNWMPIHEAISFGDIQVIKLLNDAISQKMIQFFKREFLFKVLNDIKKDFIIKFEVRTKNFNLNNISEAPPEFEVSLTKKGLKLKADISVKNYFQSTPENFHLIFNLNQSSDTFICILVGDLPIYQRVTFDDWQQIVTEIFSRETSDEEIQTLTQRENVSIDIKTDSNRSNRPIFRKTVSKKIGKYRTNIYESQGIEMTTKTRTEHLRQQNDSNTNQFENSSHFSPSPPQPRHVSWEEYINAPKGKFPYLGRELKENVETKRVSIVVGLTDEISFDWKTIIGQAEQGHRLYGQRLIQLITQFKNDLPNGFPVMIDFPIKPKVYLKWKLISLEMVSDIDESIFNVPENYQQMTIFQIERTGNLSNH